MSKADVIALTALGVFIVLAVGTISLASTRGGESHPCGGSPCVLVDGLRYASDGPFVLQAPPPPADCSGPADRVGGWSLTWGNVDFTVNGSWNCTALQNVTALGREADGNNYTAVLTNLPSPDHTVTWISPDRRFGVQLFGLTYGLAASALVQVS